MCFLVKTMWLSSDSLYIASSSGTGQIGRYAAVYSRVFEGVTFCQELHVKYGTCVMCILYHRLSYEGDGES